VDGAATGRVATRSPHPAQFLHGQPAREKRRVPSGILRRSWHRLGLCAQGPSYLAHPRRSSAIHSSHRRRKRGEISQAGRMAACCFIDRGLYLYRRRMTGIRRRRSRSCLQVIETTATNLWSILRWLQRPRMSFSVPHNSRPVPRGWPKPHRLSLAISAAELLRLQLISGREVIWLQRRGNAPIRRLHPNGRIAAAYLANARGLDSPMHDRCTVCARPNRLFQ